MKKLTSGMLAGLSIMIAAVPSTSSAQVTINIFQFGSDVALTASGTFDGTAARVIGVGSSFDQTISPRIGFVAFGTQSAVTIYNLAGPTNFGGFAGFTDTTNNSGLGIGVNANSAAFFIGSNYLNNLPFVSAATVSNATLASIGLNAGVYDFTVGRNMLTVNIGQGVDAAVPEPASWALMVAGFGAIGFAVRRRQKVSTSIRFA